MTVEKQETKSLIYKTSAGNIILKSKANTTEEFSLGLLRHSFTSSLDGLTKDDLKDLIQCCIEMLNGVSTDDR